MTKEIVVDIIIKEKTRDFYYILDSLRNMPVNKAVELMKQKYETKKG